MIKHSHFKDDKTEAETLNHLPRLTQPVVELEYKIGHLSIFFVASVSTQRTPNSFKWEMKSNDMSTVYMCQVEAGLESFYNNVMENLEAKWHAHNPETTGRRKKISWLWGPVFFFFFFCPLYVNWLLERILQKVARLEGEQTLILFGEIPLSFNMKSNSFCLNP